MNGPVQCPQCGAEMPPNDGLFGLCAVCLLREALPEESSQPSPPSEGPEQFGAFHAVSVLGEGGMGIVYLADQEQPIRRRVALKVIKLGMDTRQFIARFESERQALALMDHPNIARVYDAGATTAGRPYLAMEYVPGIPITDYCDQHLLGPRSRMELFVQVCNAIHHAHQKGVIHRDIKPSNVLVMVQDDKAVPKVIDFGVAKATNQRLTERTLFTEIGVLVGTPAYMSPEQAGMTGTDVDTTTDIYSLGVLLYELLVGALPFDTQALKKAGHDEIRRIIREQEPPRPTVRLSSLGELSAEVARLRRTDVRSLKRFLRGDVEWIAMKALEKDRARRYPSASELAADVLRHLEDEPVQAGRPGAAYRAGKFVRKHKGPVIGILAVFLSLVMGLVASTILYFRAEQQRLEAQQQRAEAERQGQEARRQRTLTEEERIKAENERREAERQTREATRQRSLTEQERLTADRERLEAERQAQEARRQRSLAEQQGAQARQSNADAQRQRSTAEEQRSAAEQKTREAEQHRATAERARLSERHQSYVANLTAADLHIRANEVSEAKRRLAQCPVELRGWEWRHLAWKTDSSVAHLQARGAQDSRRAAGAPVMVAGDGARIFWASSEALYSWAAENYAVGPGYPGFDRILAFSKDGKWIASGGRQDADSTLTVFEAASHRPVAGFGGHGGKPVYAAFSKDGSRVVSFAEAGPVVLWEAASGKQIATLRGHAGRVWAVVMSDDGRRIVSGGSDKTVRLWEASAGQALYSASGHTGAVLALAMDRARNRIFSGSADGTARIWDASTGRELHTLIGDGEPVPAVAISPDGATLASASGRIVRLWDTASGKQLATLHAAWGEDIQSAVFTPDGSRLIAMSAGGEMKVWDAARYGGTILKRHGGPLLAMAQDGTLLTAASIGVLLRQFLGIPGENANPLPGEPAQITAAAFSVRENRLVTASEGQTLRVWDLKPLRLMTTVELSTRASVIAGSHMAKRLAAASNRSVQIWDIGERSSPRQLELAPGAGPALAMAFSPDGKRLAVGTRDSGQIGIWDAGSGQPLATLTGHAGSVRAIQFTPDGARIVSGSSDQTLRIWDAGTYDPLLVLRDHEEPVTSLVCSFDGSRIYSASSGGPVRIWETLAIPGIK